LISKNEQILEYQSSLLQSVSGMADVHKQCEKMIETSRKALVAEISKLTLEVDLADLVDNQVYFNSCLVKIAPSLIPQLAS